MKTNIIKSFIIIFITSLVIQSCDKWIDPDINFDPDSPKDVNMDVLLASSEVSLAYRLGGFDVAGITSMWMRYTEGTSQQAKKINEFNFIEKDVASLWSSTYGILYDLKKIIDKSQTIGKESPYYEGIAKILMANIFGTATQLWGDIPFSEALYGDSILNPKYDTQQEVYAGIQNLLDEAIIALSIDEDSNYTNLEGDLIYKNDLDKWKKTAYSLKLRYYLHLSKLDNTVYSQIINLYNEDSSRFFASNEDDFELYFGTNENEKNPMYQFDEQRGDCSYNPFFDSLQAEKQPRINVYTPQSIWPVYLIAGDNEPFAGTFYGNPNSPVTLMSYTELQFIIAESRLEVDDTVEALYSLKTGVRAFLEKISTESETYIDYDGWMYEYEYQTIRRLYNYTDKKREIMTQKYIALFLNPEAFVDWRRTDLPDNLENSTRIMPRRFPYSSEERLYNSNFPSTSSIYAHNWFDPE